MSSIHASVYIVQVFAAKGRYIIHIYYKLYDIVCIQKHILVKHNVNSSKTLIENKPSQELFAAFSGPDSGGPMLYGNLDGPSPDG